MQKLWVAAVHRADAATFTPGNADFDKYLSTFAAPLSASKYAALQELFQVGIDPVAMGLDLAGLDEVAEAGL